MKKEIVNFGFIGAGQIAYSSADGINGHPKAKVIAAQDLHSARLNELCDAKEISKRYATATELLADPEIDAVYIAVPNKFHAPLAIQALEAGKHVILDKPFALNLAEAEQVVAAAKKSGKVFTLGMNQRFGKNAQAIKTLAEKGEFGEVYHAKAYWFRRSGIPKLGTWFGNKELAGAGCLYDIGVHLLDLALYVLGNFEPASVSGQTYTKFGNRGLGAGGWGKSDKTDLKFDVDDFATGLIRFKNGATLSLDVSWACHAEEGNRMDVQLYGTNGGALTQAGKIFRQDPVTGEYFTIQGGGFPNVTPRYTHSDRFHNFINHLLEGEPLCVTIEQALAVQKILDALAQSSIDGKQVHF